MGWAQLATVLGAVASMLTIIPFAMRLFVTPIIQKQINELEKSLGRKFNTQAKETKRLESRLSKHIEEGNHYGR